MAWCEHPEAAQEAGGQEEAGGEAEKVPEVVDVGQEAQEDVDGEQHGEHDRRPEAVRKAVPVEHLVSQHAACGRRNSVMRSVWPSSRVSLYMLLT